ncbi:MAG: tetratricopeptide repeat protein [Phycisphaerae bacterium]
MSTRVYLFTARTRDGREVTDRVVAASAAMALKLIEARGFVEPTLLDDDSYPREVSDAGRDLQKHFPPAMDARLRTANANSTFFLLVANQYRQSALILGALAVIFIYRRVVGASWGFLEITSITFLVLPVLLVAFLLRGSNVHRQVQSLAIEAKWDEVAALLPKLERTLRKIGARGELEMAVWRARVMIEQQNVSDALREVAKFRDREGIPERDVLVALARVHSSIPDHDAALRCFQGACAIAPDLPNGWMGVAETYILHKRMPIEARAALIQARSLPLNHMNRVGTELLEGAVKLCEGNPRAAQNKIAGALPEIEKISRANPVAIGVIRMYEALLAEIYARLGDWPRARQFQQRCEPYLNSHRQTHLLAECHTLLQGAPPDDHLSA